MKEITIYALKDPITKQPFYVGASKNIKSRFSNHCSRPTTKKGKELQLEELTPLLEILEQCPLEKAKDTENYWMQYYEKQGFKLHNQSSSSYNPIAGRKPYADPEMLKQKLIIYPLAGEIELMGGEEVARTFLMQAWDAKIAEKKEGGVK